jgi:1,4-alpha-glucan branching enzyme/maltooligosyltrehalose trehalohydrolase
MPPQNTSHSQFSMNFGTRILSDGGILFRLWAPEAGQVDLHLIASPASPNTQSTEKKVLPMAQQEDGWFAVQSKDARVGDLYQFMIDRNQIVPDPAGRCQSSDIHGPSVICDPDQYSWQDAEWQGRPWEESVIYELHTGTFSPEGTFKGVTGRLDYLVELGITAIELMPVAQFPGTFNWGYDGALLFAPCSLYGKPEDLKELIDAAHRKGLMVFLDVVYNHFGPEGNYLHVYARDAFFTEKFHTPWGAAINFSGKNSRIVRDFYIANVLYWLEEYHFDGLRFDAVHSIFDESHPDILEEIAEKVRIGPGSHRHVHLILENDNNCSRYLARDSNGRPRYYTAQWNDDFHHACHTLLTGEAAGYYKDYSDTPMLHLGRCLTEGFAYQGQESPYRQGEKRGDPSAHLPPLAFVSFLQNHDQIGNRAFGERLISLCDPRDLHIFTALFLLAPSPPLLFMGEEFGTRTPFCFFSNFSSDLAESVTEGRRKEFEKFPQFHSPESRERIPDPNAEATFLMSRLDWQTIDENGENSENSENSFLALYRKLLQLRQQVIVPHLKNIRKNEAGYHVLAEKALRAWWRLANGDALSVVFNLHDLSITINPSTVGTIWANEVDIMSSDHLQLLYQYRAEEHHTWSPNSIAPKSIIWLIDKKVSDNA